MVAGIQRWQEVSQGKSSDELVGILLEELGKASAGDAGAPEYFEGQVGNVYIVATSITYRN